MIFAFPGLEPTDDVDEEWLRLTPEQRFEESGKLWQIYLAMGGSLDPEPDPQSPFFYPEMQFATVPEAKVSYKMLKTNWKPEYTSRSLEIWCDYQSQHDLSELVGQVAAIDPQTGTVWIARNGVDVANLVRAEVGSNPVYLVEVGSEFLGHSAGPHN